MQELALELNARLFWFVTSAAFVGCLAALAVRGVVRVLSDSWDSFREGVRGE